MNKAQIFAAIEKRFTKQVAKSGLVETYDQLKQERANMRTQVDARKRACDDLLKRKSILENALIFGAVNEISVPDSVPEELLSVSDKLSHSLTVINDLDKKIDEKQSELQILENLTFRRLVDEYELRIAIGMTKQKWDEFKEPYVGKIF